jgi:ethanolamine ammonia-lyase small subunit
MSEADEWAELAAFTPARVALGRAGSALPTRRVLEFQLAHARARDAVLAPFDADALARSLAPRDCVCAESQAPSREVYLARPDLGRCLGNDSRRALPHGTFDAVLVIAGGLSATAIDAHAPKLTDAIFASLPSLSWAPTVIVANGRVAIGDDIAAAVGADIAVVMIGERPGLSAADSIGLYMTWKPRRGVTTDAERNCISNVRPGGLPFAEAAHRLSWLMTQSRKLRLSGVGLKEDAPDVLPGAAPQAGLIA